MLEVDDPPNLVHHQKLAFRSQQQFMAAFAVKGTIAAACRSVTISRDTYYRWFNDDLYGFKARFAAAQLVFRELFLEAKLFELIGAMDGRPGQNVIPLVFALKAHWRDKYGDTVTIQDDTGKTLIDKLRALGDSRTIQVEVEGAPPPGLSDRLKLR